MASNEIVIGLDDSPSGRAAVAWAAEQARLTDCRLRAVHVLDWPYGPSQGGYGTPVDIAELSHGEVEDAYRSRITRAFDSVQPQPDWVLQFARGEAGRVLVRQSREARLLVVGTREHVGLGRILVGSVSHYCLSHAATPVVAVPALQPESAEPARTDQAAPEPIFRTATPAAPTRIPERVVVVGVDASAEALAAARYAVQAADLRGLDLLLVHAYWPPYADTGPAGLSQEFEQQEANHLVERVAAQLRVPPDLRLHVLTEAEDPAVLLERASRQAALVAVGQDRVTLTERLVLGSVAAQVVQRVSCPAVVVPSGWRVRHAGSPPPVVAALDGETAAEPVLSLAFAEARLRQAPLLALHVEPHRSSREEVTAAGAGILTMLAGWKQDNPDVAVESAVVSGDADAALVRWSRSASVLVVGRPHRRGWGSWTRSAVQSVLKHARCPLLVAPAAGGATSRVAGDTARRGALAD